MTAFAIEPLARHDRTLFDCGVEPLNRFFREQLTQDMRRRICNCYVAIDAAGQVAGYYTLAATGLPLGELASEESRRLPRYKLIPAALIGRLAVSVAARGHGLGAALIVDAIGRAVRSELVAYALSVDAKDDEAARFYDHLGFRRFQSLPGTLYLPLGEAVRRFPLG
jgi:GNAT superfamily N-acetyltransferase